MSLLGANASIEAGRASSRGGGGGLTEAQVDARINALALTSSAAASKYLKIADADDQYAPRTRAVQVTCTATGLNGTTESALATNFAGSFASIDASRVTAHITGTSLRIQVSCVDTNVQATETAMPTTSAAMTTALNTSGVFATSNPVVSRSLLTFDGSPLLSVVS
jgi:hypothetical protein